MKYYLVGIKGAGLSALALILKNTGNEVNGYDDEKKHQFTEDKLIDAGIKIYTEDNDCLKEGVIVIRSTAVNQNTHPQILKAEKLNLKVYEYMEFLGKLTKEYKTIAVSGVHGKTTTTSMLASILDSVYGCNYLIGDGNGYAQTNNEYFLIEACEYRRNFLHYSPKIGIITNVDLDHVDYYKDIDDVQDAFISFANNCEEIVFIYGDDDKSKNLNINPKKVTYGLNEDNDIQAREVSYSKKGIDFDVYIKNEFFYHFSLPFFGAHQLLNSLAVIGVCNYLNIKGEDIHKYLQEFKGAARRFNELIVGQTVIIDDYGHHPNEIKTTILAARQKYPKKKLIAVLEPHTFSRIKKFYKEIAEALNFADEAYVLDIFKSRENPEDYPDVTSDLIIKNLKKGHHLTRDCQELFQYKNEVVLFLSPKDVNDLIENLVKGVK